MGNDEGGPPFTKHIQIVLQVGLGLQIKGAGRLIEDDNAGIT